MTEQERFSGMKKIPDGPVSAVLAAENGKLLSDVEMPADATVPDALAILEEANEIGDQLTVLSCALPVRERIWWACLSSRDLLPPGDDALTPCVQASEAWVLAPNDDNRNRAREALEAADPDDDTIHCAFAVAHHDGKLGPGSLSNLEAPKGAAATGSLLAAVKSLFHDPDAVEERGRLLVDRAIDIARGGNGQIGSGQG